MYIQKQLPDFIPRTPIAVDISNIRRNRPHYHTDTMEFVYCICGSADFTIAHEHMTLEEGQVVLIEHENVHSVSSDSNNILLTVHIDMSKCCDNWKDIKYMFFSCATSLCKPYQISPVEKIYEALLSSAYIYTSQKEDCCREYDKLISLILDLLINHFTWFSIESFTSEDSKKFKDRLNRILIYIQQHYEEKITLAEIAKNEYINENYFSQFLKRTSFHSFTRMLNYIRCFEAEKLLLTTDLSIQEISDRCGFSSQKYFHKYFKFFWETTPLQHRKSCRKKLALPDNIYSCTPEKAHGIIQNKVCEYLKDRLLR